MVSKRYSMAFNQANFLNIWHGIASYPKSFRGCVVSENKICLQFDNPDLKLRVDADHKENLTTVNGSYTLKVSADNTPVRFLAVGCRLDTINDLQNQLIDAYMEHEATFGQTPAIAHIVENLRKRLEGF
jgi:hypothetical protein